MTCTLQPRVAGFRSGVDVSFEPMAQLAGTDDSEQVLEKTAAAEPSEALLEKVRRLVETCRDRCLWFLAADHLPADREQALRALEYIERYGDRQAFVEARKLRRCLSPISSVNSAG
jgi:hypothetical protein